jgi:hypothetical protein
MRPQLRAPSQRQNRHKITDNSNYAEQDGTDRGEDRRLSGVLYGGQGYVIHDFEKNPIEFVFVKHATPR